MAQKVREITTGFITLEGVGNIPVKHAINVTPTDIIGDITQVQISSLRTIANLLAVLIRTLIARDVLDEQFMEDNEYDLPAIIQSIENLGGDFGEPDISVTG